VVYLGSADSHLYAVDSDTGEEKWRFKTEDFIGSTPAVSDGVVYFGSGDKHLYAVDSNTGEEKWKFETGSEVNSPTLSAGIVYFGFGHNLYAVDSNTGEEKWKFKTKGLVYSPAVSDGVVYLGSADSHLYAVDSDTGKEKWKFKTDRDVYSPAVSDGVVYLGSADSHLYAVDSDTGEEKWKFRIEGGISSTPTISEGTVYIGSYNSHLYAVDNNTGEEKWKFKTGDYILSFPTISEGIVYFGSDDSHLYAVDIDIAEKFLPAEQKRQEEEQKALAEAQEEADEHGITVEDIRTKFISGDIKLEEAIELQKQHIKEKGIVALLKRDLMRAVWNEADTDIFSQSYEIEVTHDQAWDVKGEQLEEVDPDADDYDPDGTETVRISVGDVIDYDIKQFVLDHFTIDDLDSGVVSKKDIEDCIYSSLSGLCSSFRNTPIYDGDDDTLYLEVETPILSMEDLNPEWIYDEYNLDDEILADYIDDIYM
jgi:outer membrane protein assembly factor BamB